MTQPEKELVAVKSWDGNDGWGGVWGRSTFRERRAYAAIMLVWFVVVICFGGYKIFAG